jgi:hypothetical protein
MPRAAAPAARLLRLSLGLLTRITLASWLIVLLVLASLLLSCVLLRVAGLHRCRVLLARLAND